MAFVAPGSSEDVGGIALGLWNQMMGPSTWGRGAGAPGGVGGPAAAPPGYVTGPRGTQGSEATGFIPPGVPDPIQSAADATKGNIANMPNLTNLYGQIANTYVPGYAGLSGQESTNIARLLNPAPLDPRYIAESAAGLGTIGSPASSAMGYRMTDRDWMQHVLAGSQMLSGAAQRGRGIYDLSGAMTTPTQVQAAREEANLFANAPNPAAAHNLALQDALMGLRMGGGSQRGPVGGGRTATGNVGSASDIMDMVNRIMQKYGPQGGGGGYASVGASSPPLGGGYSAPPPYTPFDPYSLEGQGTQYVPGADTYGTDPSIYPFDPYQEMVA